jgi:hypothetical protein
MQNTVKTATLASPPDLKVISIPRLKCVIVIRTNYWVQN